MTTDVGAGVLISTPPPAAGPAIEALRRGGHVVILDTVGSAPTAYLVGAAAAATPESITTMVREAPGPPWLALPVERCRQLGLREMAQSNPAMRGQMGTIEAREGVTTGISAADRARTVRVAGDAASGPRDIVTPGHVVVVQSAADGILERLAAPEAANELVALAAWGQGAVMCEILDERGELADVQATGRWAAARSLPSITTLGVLDAKLGREPFVELQGEHELATPAGTLRAFAFLDRYSRALHYAVVHGDPRSGAPATVAMLDQEPLRDGLGIDRSVVVGALERVAAAELGVLLYLAPAPSAPERPGDPAHDARQALLATKRQGHVASQTLAALGVGAIRASTQG